MKILYLATLSFLLTICAAFAAAPDKDMKITVFGSSTVWGNGLLGERSMAGIIDDSLRNSWSQSVYPENMKFSSTPQVIKNRKFYRGKAAKIAGVGSSVEFNISGKKLVIWQAISRTCDYGVMTVYADGKKIGTFDNKNNSLGSEEISFSGNGVQKMFPLKRAFTYGHQIAVNGKTQKFKLYDLPYVKGDIAKYFPGYDGVIVRGKPGNKVEHFACFFKAPAGKVDIKFNYGETIAYTKCTVGGLAEDENTLESTFGVGHIPYDLANPSRLSSGLDFRYSNDDAAKVFEFDTPGQRAIKIEITGGTNPYFMINFASNAKHQIMNAGIGGYTAFKFLRNPDRLQVSDALKISVPDAAFIILGGNDDWYEAERLVTHSVFGLSEKELGNLKSMFYSSITPEKDGTYTAVKNSGIIQEITPISLVSPQLVGAKVAPGNYLRIGNYYGDNLSTAVRRIKKFDSQSGKVTWEKPLDADQIVGINKIDDLKGAEFTLRTLDFYKKNIAGMVDVLRKANPQMKIVLLNTYTPNYFCREVWGYAEALEDVANKYQSVAASDTSPEIYKWIQTQFSATRRKFTFKSNGSARYTIEKKGHWQGFQVWVNGQNVYGKDCRVESGSYYAPEKLKNGVWKTGRTNNWVKRPMQLHFTSNIPPAGTVIEVKFADKVWSNDYAHPTEDGCAVIGETAYKALCQLLQSSL